MTARRFSSRAGFTLIELSIVLAILGLLAGGLLAGLTQASRRANMQEVAMKMDAIEKALLNYRKLYNRLPCPANSTSAITSAYFGVESANPGVCTGGSPASPLILTAYTGYSVPTGDVPTKTLGLPDDYMFDPWGGRFSYAPLGFMTNYNAFTTYPVAGFPNTFTIQDGAGNFRSTNTVYVLLSYGPNGHGSFQLSGATKSFGTTNANELINCHCNSSGTLGTGTGTAAYVQAITDFNPAAPTVGFDDIVRYYKRSDLLSSTELGGP